MSRGLAGLTRRLAALARADAGNARQDLAELRNALRREVDRARRYERTFALVRAPLLPAVTAAERRHGLGALRATLRSMDHLCIAGDQAYFLLPEGDRAMGERLASRVRRNVPGFFGEGVATVAFPEDGVTLGALLAQLRTMRARPSRQRAEVVPRRVAASVVEERLGQR